MKTPLGTLALAGLVAGIASAGLYSAPVMADDGFYKGKRLKMVVRSGAGGGYDYYGRLISRHMTKYLPGKEISEVILGPLVEIGVFAI